MTEISGAEARAKLLEALQAEEGETAAETPDEMLLELRKLNDLLRRSLEVQEAILSELRRPSRTTLMG